MINDDDDYNERFEKFVEMATEAVEQAYKDALVYGSGYIEVTPTMEFRYIPFNKFDNKVIN